MNTIQIPSTVLTSLNPQDRALVALLHAERFNINALINKQNPIHPAQSCILDLLEWVSQPHIDAAIQHIVDLTDALSAKADEEVHLIAKKSLSHVLAITASMIPHFDSSPADPQEAERFTRHSETLIRETRLLARTLLKFLPPVPPRSRRSKPISINEPDFTTELDSDIAADTTSDAASEVTSGADTAASSDSSDSTHIPRSTRSSRISHLNRNSRKPTISPAQVAEILSPLLDHEAEPKPPNALAANTTPGDDVPRST